MPGAQSAQRLPLLLRRRLTVGWPLLHLWGTAAACPAGSAKTPAMRSSMLAMRGCSLMQGKRSSQGSDLHGRAVLCARKGISLSLLGICARDAHGVRVLYNLPQAALGQPVSQHCRGRGDQPEAQTPVQCPLLDGNVCVSRGLWEAQQSAGTARTVSLDMR